MPLFQGFRPVTGTICPSRAAAVVGPSRAPQGMKKGRRPRRRPRLKLSDKAGPDQCPVPGENTLFPAQIAGFLAVSRPVPVYPVFLNYVVPVHSSPVVRIRDRRGVLSVWYSLPYRGYKKRIYFGRKPSILYRQNVEIIAMRLYNVTKSTVSHVKTIKICTKYPVSAHLTDIIFSVKRENISNFTT